MRTNLQRFADCDASTPHTIPGGIYEYSVENASLTTEPTLERRTAKLQRAVAQRAAEVRHEALKLDFQRPPGKL